MRPTLGSGLAAGSVGNSDASYYIICSCLQHSSKPVSLMCFVNRYIFFNGTLYGSVGTLIGCCTAADVIHCMVHSPTLTWDLQDRVLWSGAAIGHNAAMQYKGVPL